jgi:hypothetical protein
VQLLYILNVRQVDDCLVRILSLLCALFLVGSATLNCETYFFNNCAQTNLRLKS